jgi:hypothetical protein
MYGKLAAEHHVRRSMALARAKGKGSTQFEEFCERVNLRPSSSTTRKYLKIGVEGDWLLLIAKNLPADWTTIYNVAVIGENKARDLIEHGFLHPEATAKKLKEVERQESCESEQVAPAEFTLRVKVSGLPDDEVLRACRDLANIVRDHHLEISGLPQWLSERLIEREAV